MLQMSNLISVRYSKFLKQNVCTYTEKYSIHSLSKNSDNRRLLLSKLLQQSSNAGCCIGLETLFQAICDTGETLYSQCYHNYIAVFGNHLKNKLNNSCKLLRLRIFVS